MGDLMGDRIRSEAKETHVYMISVDVGFLMPVKVHGGMFNKLMNVLLSGINDLGYRTNRDAQLVGNFSDTHSFPSHCHYYCFCVISNFWRSSCRLGNFLQCVNVNNEIWCICQVKLKEDSESFQRFGQRWLLLKGVNVTLYESHNFFGEQQLVRSSFLSSIL